ncbi:MAG: hypothetical protein WC947_03885 [Elusimicrobiota bacterium]
MYIHINKTLKIFFLILVIFRVELFSNLLKVYAEKNNNDVFPKLVEAFPNPPLPNLQIGQIKNEQDFHFFTIQEGLILYHQQENKWQRYNNLMGYESYGLLKNVIKTDERIWIVLEKGTIGISRNLDPISLDFSTDVIGYKNPFVYFLILSDGLKHRKVEDNYEKYYREDFNGKITLRCFNIKNNKLSDIYSDELKDTGYFYSAIFYKNHFWLAFEKKLITISIEGEVKDLSSVKDFPNQVVDFLIYNDTLYFSSDGIYECVCDDSSNSIPKVKKIISDYRNVQFKSQTPYDDGVFIVPENSPLMNTILNFTSKNSSLKPFKLFLPYPKPSSPDKILYFNNHLWLLSLPYRVVAKMNIQENKYSYYLFEEGMPGEIQYLVENSSEVWFTCRTHGVIKYEKIKKSWELFPITWKFPEINVSEITMNSDYVFVNSHDRYGDPIKYCVINKKTGSTELLNNEDLQKRFIPSYIALKYKYVWTPLLFLLNLPLTGIDIDHKRYLIQKENYSLLSTNLEDEKGYSYGAIVKFDYSTKKVEIFKLPSHHFRKYLKTSVSPFQITGDENIVWGIANEKGIFKFDLRNNEFYETEKWFNEFQNNWSIGEDKDRIFIGCGRKNDIFLKILDKTSKSIRSFGTEVGITNTPSTYYFNEQYDFFATSNELIYYDKKNQKWGKLTKEWSRLYQSDYNIYVNTSGKYYKIITERK